eukprot:scaffold275067_cov25-Attheya_sp.AAC.2
MPPPRCLCSSHGCLMWPPRVDCPRPFQVGAKLSPQHGLPWWRSSSSHALYHCSHWRLPRGC